MKERAAEQIVRYLPDGLRQAFLNIDPEHLATAEELRITTEKPLVLYGGGKVSFIDKFGRFTDSKNATLVTREETGKVVQAICDNSVYSVQSQLCSGFVTLSGGHRAGVTGRTVTENGRITHMTDISSVCIRFAREVRDAARPLFYHVIGKNGPKNTLIISPPGCGKTTILRDLSRLCGGGEKMYKTAVVDERCELAACRRGVPTLDVGLLTVVLEACPKSEGMLILLRSASPDIILTDEIGSDEDARALHHVINAGVKVICSAHGYDKDDAARKPALKELIDGGMFETIVVLSRREGPGTIEKIYGG